MDCPFYTKKKRGIYICMRYSSPYYQQPCPFGGELEECRKGGGSVEPLLMLPFDDNYPHETGKE